MVKDGNIANNDLEKFRLHFSSCMNRDVALHSKHLLKNRVYQVAERTTPVGAIKTSFFHLDLFF